RNRLSAPSVASLLTPPTAARRERFRRRGLPTLAVLNLLDDLAAEHDALDAVLGGLSFSDWDVPTPGGEWRVRDQVGHLAYFDSMGTLAARDGAGFEAKRDRGLADMDAFAVEAQSIGREQTGDELLTTWRSLRREMLTALAGVPDGARL